MEQQENLNPEEMTNQSLANDAVPVCPNCLEPCDPRCNYCPNCGSNEVINPLASYMPFVDLRFRLGMIGKLWRKTWANETAWLDRGIYISLFILFYPIILIIGLSYLLYEKIKCGKQETELFQKNE